MLQKSLSATNPKNNKFWNSSESPLKMGDPLTGYSQSYQTNLTTKENFKCESRRLQRHFQNLKMGKDK